MLNGILLVEHNFIRSNIIIVSLICKAINLNRVLRFQYGGGYREVEPYCHGVSTAGNEVLRAYQLRGHSKSGEHYGWKLFKVDEMNDLILTNEYFTGSRAEYNPVDPGMVEIHCNI